MITSINSDLLSLTPLVSSSTENKSASSIVQAKLKDPRLAEIMSSLGSNCTIGIGKIIKSYTGDLEGNDLIIETIQSAIKQEPAIPTDLCKIIQEYLGNHGEAMIEQFVRGLQALRIPGLQLIFIPTGAFEQAKALLQENRIDKTAITTLDLSGIDWHIRHRMSGTRDRAEINREARMRDLCNQDHRHVLLLLIQEIAPNLKHLKMTKWIYNEPNNCVRLSGITQNLTQLRITDVSHNEADTSVHDGYGWAVVDKMHHSLGTFTGLETLEVSYDDLVVHTEGYFLKKLSASLSRHETKADEVSFPKLKTIRVIGGTLSAATQDDLKRARPTLMIECLNN